MLKLNWLVAACAVALVACSGTGGTGAITGTLTVAGEKRADVSVDLLGPVTRGAVTDANGAFTFNGLPDGDFVVRATVAGTRESTRVASVQIKGGKSSGEATLTFTTDAPVTISGHVVFSDGSDATGVVVTAAGAVTKVATTEAGGAFSFAGLPPGGYVISAEVGDTREQRVSLGANAVADLDVGSLTFTPSGKLPGTVSFNGAPAAGVQIIVTGTSLTAISGDNGQFVFGDVPTGAQTLLARVGDAPFYRSATATVTVTRGANTAVELALTDAPLPTGTVRGKVLFEAGAASPSRITVSASGVSATPAANGDFSLELPIGHHQITATAAHYPVQVIGQVTVGANETHWLAQAALSYFTAILSNPNAVMYIDSILRDEWAPPPTHDLQLLELCDNYVTDPWGEWSDCLAYSLRLLNVATGELTPVFFGAWDTAVISPAGDLVAWADYNGVWTYSVATRAVRAYALPDDNSWSFNQAHFGNPSGNIFFGSDYYSWSRAGTGLNSGGPALVFDADGQHLSFARSFSVARYVNGQYSVTSGLGQVTRISLSDGTTSSTPGPVATDVGIEFGYQPGLEYLADGQWIYVESELDGGATLHQFNALGLTTVFSGATSYPTEPLPADFRTLEDGGVQLSVLPLNASAPVVVQGVSGTATISSASGTSSFPVVRLYGPLEDGGSLDQTLVITAATGATYDLGANYLGSIPNPAGTTLLYANAALLQDGGANLQVRLLPLPPTGLPALVAEGADIDEPSWFTNSTVVVPRAPQSADAGYELTVSTNGALTTLTGVPGAYPSFGSAGVVLRTAAGWRVVAGDGVFSLPVPPTAQVSPGCAPSFQSWSQVPPAVALGVQDNVSGFITLNTTTGATRAFQLSDLHGCNIVGTEVVGPGESYLNGAEAGAVFFFVSGDTVYWKGGAWANTNDESDGYVGSERAASGLVHTTSDGHTLGFARLY